MLIIDKRLIPALDKEYKRRHLPKEQIDTNIERHLKVFDHYKDQGKLAKLFYSNKWKKKEECVRVVFQNLSEFYWVCFLGLFTKSIVSCASTAWFLCLPVLLYNTCLWSIIDDRGALIKMEGWTSPQVWSRLAVAILSGIQSSSSLPLIPSPYFPIYLLFLSHHPEARPTARWSMSPTFGESTIK